jgi:hypothetical protein
LSEKREAGVMNHKNQIDDIIEDYRIIRTI